MQGWWERFSGRFKRLNKVLGVESEGRMTSDNDLHYQHLLPHSPVFTLGFTGLEPHPAGLTPDTQPHFSEVTFETSNSAEGLRFSRNKYFSITVMTEALLYISIINSED